MAGFEPATSRGILMNVIRLHPWKRNREEQTEDIVLGALTAKLPRR